MEILEHAPGSWDEQVKVAALLQGFTEAHRELGYQVYYLKSSQGFATFHVREGNRMGGPLFRRANTFCDARSALFMKEVVAAAKTLSIPLLRLGNPIFGFERGLSLQEELFILTKRHTFITDLTQGMDRIVQQFSATRRRNINKARRSGIQVSLLNSPQKAEWYFTLSKETTDRIRAHKYYRSYPLRFFTSLLDTMLPRQQVLGLIAERQGMPLAGGLFTIKNGMMVYYHGCSARREGEGSLQAASLLFLHALEQAKMMGCRNFDWGGCSPDAPKNDSRHGVYRYKKGWGGELATFYNADLWVNQAVAWIQERVLAPIYDRLRRNNPTLAERVAGQPNE
jgi:lipid II:glycine glycyltransferase (peptidoglycan interpeptide bridge formation enzyme)